MKSVQFKKVVLHLVRLSCLLGFTDSLYFVSFIHLVIMSSAPAKATSKDHKAKVSTVKKWESELKCKLEYDVNGADAICLRCVVCKRWEKRIEKVKGFNTNWIRPGAKSIKKDGLKSHLETNQHKEAVRLEQRSNMGAEVYNQTVLESSPIGRAVRRLQEKDKASLRVKFNMAYYLAKRERPFTDYIGAVTKETFAKDFANARYYSILSDGSTDSAVIEQEIVYVLYLSSGGIPAVKYFSIESAENGDADGLKECIISAFNRFGITNFSDRLLGLNVDGASVNTGIHKGLGAKIKEEASWLQVVHCFNHRLELALKDAFLYNSSFNRVEEFLNEIYLLYRTSPKRYRELQRVAEAYGEAIPRPTKAYGTRWIDHKLRAVKIGLEHYGALITHIESLSQTDSQAKRRAQLKGFLKRWKNPSVPISMAIYLDILSPMRRLSLSFQKELHDPVKAVRRVQEFTWTMAKLQLLIENSLDSEDSIMTNYKQVLTKIVEKVFNNKDGKRKTKYFYQEVKLKNYELTKEKVQASYVEAIRNIADCMEERFSSLYESPLFKDMTAMLDVSTWPPASEAENFSDDL